MNLLDLLFPKYCLECKRPGKYICDGCLAKVAHAKLVCPVCKKFNYLGKTHPYCISKLSLNGAYSAYGYEGVIRSAILALKYKFAYSIAEELANAVDIKLNTHFNSVVLIPVPLHKTRENWRGFNQAATLGKLLAEKMNWRYSDNLVLRSENTTPQVKLGKTERLQNIRGKFAVNPEAVSVILGSCRSGVIESPTFVIFDDVVTTGATISEIARTLKKSGAKEVWGVSIAKT